MKADPIDRSTVHVALPLDRCGGAFTSDDNIDFLNELMEISGRLAAEIEAREAEVGYIVIAITR